MRKGIVQRDLLSGVFLLVFSAFLWSTTTTFPKLANNYPGPALFPQVIAVSLGIMGTYLLLSAIRSRNSFPSPQSEKASKGRLLRFIAGLVLVSTYPFLVDHIHFVPVMAGLIFFFGLILNNKPWKAMLTAVLSAGLIYGLFTRLLGVPL